MIDLPVGALVVVGGVSQVLVQRLAVDRQGLRPRLRDGGDAGRGGDVHHIEGRAGDALGEPQDAAEAQILREAIVDLGEILEADPALADQLGVHVHDDVVVLGMDDAEPARLRQHLERLPDVAEIDHAPGARGQDVGGEYLQRRIAGLDRLSELSGKFRRRLRVQHEVVGPVAGTLADEIAVAGFDRLAGRSAVAPIGEIDERGGATEQGGTAHLLGPGGDERRAVGLGPGMMQVHMRIDAARHDDEPARIDHAPGRRRRQHARSRHRRDGLPGNRHVALDDALRRDHVAAANDRVEHPASRRLACFTSLQYRL